MRKVMSRYALASDSRVLATARARTRRMAHALVALIATGCLSSHGGRTSSASPASAFDVVIEHGQIVDGTGNNWFYGDVGIRGDRIARITPPGLLSKVSAKRRIDAKDLIVSPGFIDIQGQSQLQLTFGDSRLVSKVTQGVTTEILGEGGTLAPVNANLLKTLDQQLEALRTGFGFTRAKLDSIRKTVMTFAGDHGFGHWLDAMQTHGMGVNAGSFVGAETIRVYAKGFAEGAPNAAELDTMRAVTAHAMEDGAFGVGSALIYPPGNFATTDELIEIAKTMSPYGGVYITHMRSEADYLLEAIDEAMRIGREGHVPVEIFHLKAAGVRNWPKAADAVAKIDFARANGVDISADMYPYVAGGTGLAACVPPWATANNKLLDNLRDPTTRARIVTEMHDEHTTWENLCNLATPSGVMVVGITSEAMRKYEGRRVNDIAKDMNKDWADAVIDVVLAEKGGPGMIVFLMSEENVEMQLAQPWMKIGTDADGEDPDSAKGLTHPRTYGTYPRILGKYVRERRLMPVEEAVRKMSSAVADRLSIQGRGVLREGMFADVAIWNPTVIIDRATFTRPHVISDGVRYVLVNGVLVVDAGKVTGAKPGRVIRGPGWAK